ncbi:hypothetical protein ACFSVK_06165 [Azorhizophilus paspali]
MLVLRQRIAEEIARHPVLLQAIGLAEKPAGDAGQQESLYDFD